MADGEQSGDGAQQAPGAGEPLSDAARRLYAETRATARSLAGTLDALTTLAGHEAALARAALPQAVLMAGVGVALGLAGWLYLMALLVALLQPWLGWAGALGLATLLSLAGAAAAVWRCLALLKMSRFEATRRQLRLLRRQLRSPSDAAGGDTATDAGNTPGATTP